MTSTRFPPGIEALLRHHEDERSHPYDDRTGLRLKRGDTLQGFLSIGIGRNLTIVGLRPNEVQYLLVNDVLDCWRALLARLPWIEALDQARQLVLLDMCFNMGPAKYLTDGTQRLFPAIKSGRYHDAAVIMLEWGWAAQVGPRARRLANMMRTGTLPTDVKGLS